MAKQMMFDEFARREIRDGLSQLASAVKVTLGPVGKNVILQKSWGSPRVTKDGVSVSKEIELPDPFKNMGAKMVGQVASKTSDVVGDGTTTATLLAEAIYNEGLKQIAAGVNPMMLQRSINKATTAAVDSIASQSKKVKSKDDIVKVGTISANCNLEIGKLLAEAMEKAGEEGVISVEEGKGIETELEVVKGMQFDKGYISPYFITKPDSMEAVLEDCLILIHEKKISSLRDIIPLLEKIAGKGKPLLIIAEDIEGEALAALVINRLRGVLHCAAVKAPGFGDRRKALLADIAILTGGQVVSEDIGIKLENVEVSQLGKARRITITKDHTTLIEGGGKKKDISSRIEQIKMQINKTTSDYDKEKLQERLAKLAGGVALIRAGAATETEMKERKDLIDDALHATRAAIEEGIVPGGGVVFLRAAGAVKQAQKNASGEEKIGYDIVARALVFPTRQIVENAGGDGAMVVAELMEKKGAAGYDVEKGRYVDMFEAGIVDPAKVSRAALQNAA
ncbi:MAG: chaperonin GroEL, partial [Planctomycetes bacterium]|nr:chaperonin GroEL [Planctomycetota bacterium]